MKQVILVSLFLLQACSIPSYTTSQGIKVFNYSNIATRYEVERIIDYAEESLPNTLDKERLRGFTFVFIDKWIQIKGLNPEEAIIADGWTDLINRMVFISTFQTCLADSSLLHELMHILRTENHYDYEHSDKKFWQWVDKMGTVIALDLCPKDYLPRQIPAPSN